MATVNPTGLSNAMATTNFAQPVKGGPIMGGETYPVGAPGNYNFGNSTNPNPPGAPPSTAPTTSKTPGAPGTQPFNPGTPADYSKDLLSKLNDTFGSGMGALINDFLTKGQGGYNDAIAKQAVDSTIAGMEHNIAKGYGTLNTELGQQGVSPQSSVAALEKGDYMSNAIAQENQITASMYYDMWNQSESRQYGLLGGIAGATHEHQGNAGDWAKQFGEVAGGIGSIIGGAGYSSEGGGGFTL